MCVRVLVMGIDKRVCGAIVKGMRVVATRDVAVADAAALRDVDGHVCESCVVAWLAHMSGERRSRVGPAVYRLSGTCGILSRRAGHYFGWYR